MNKMALALAALVVCAACDDGGGGESGDPDQSVRVDGAVDAGPGMDATPPDQGVDASPPDQGLRPDQGADAGPPPGPPRRPGRLQWTGGPQGRGLPSFDYRGVGVRLRGSLTP